ncbi:MAG: IclR family transcriptional regulator [Spirochaetia bacterium]|jgi:DNA-binding IclR family transcriptional regulator|nr:IclR family transcriptional regulator [Spirochaetia bacterium]
MQLINRTLAILTLLSKEPDGVSVKSVSDELGISTSAVHRILSCLKEDGFAFQDNESKKYRIGFKVLTLAQNISQKNALTKIAHEYMNALSKELNKTVELCIVENGSTVCIDYIQNIDTQYFYVRTGFAIPKYATSAGKVIDAYLPTEEVINENKENSFKKIAPNTITDINTYLAELQKIRQLGYAKSNEELQVGVIGVACPIFDSMDKPIASVSFNNLKETGDIDIQMIEKLRQCANDISYSLGFREDQHAK